MSKITKKILGASLSLAAFSFGYTQNVQAQSCVVLPTCEELGYTDTPEYCENGELLKCPFDESKVFCRVAKACLPNACSGYTLSSCPPNGNCSTCDQVNDDCSNGGTKYKLDSCKPNYYISGENGDRCQNCDDYFIYPYIPSSSSCSTRPNSEDRGVGECGQKYYRACVCKSGYDWNGSSCVATCTNNCEGYPLTSCTSGWGTVSCSTCTDCSGTKKYKITSCPSGFKVNSDGSNCEPTTCTAQYGSGFYVKGNCPSGQIEELNMCGNLGQSSTICCKCVESNNCSAQCSQLYGTSNECYGKCVTQCGKTGTPPTHIEINGKVCSIR